MEVEGQGQHYVADQGEEIQLLRLDDGRDTGPRGVAAIAASAARMI